MEPQYPSTALISEARRLRNLGRYPEAESKFREAIAAQDEIDLHVELASMFTEQGKVRKCHEQLANLAAQSELSPVGRMLLCVANAGISVQLAPNLETAVSLYNAHLLRRRPEDYEKLHVPLLCTYLSLISLAELCGADTASAPSPSLEFLNKLFQHLVKENRLQAAMSVAWQYAARAIPPKATFLLEELLGHAVPLTAGTDGASEVDCDERLILRAHVLMELADWLRKAGKKKERKTMIAGAAQSYERAGHATGGAMAEVSGFDVTATKSASHRRQQRERLLANKDKLERFEYYEGVRSALGALYDLALADKDHEFLVTLDSEHRRISETRGFLLDVSTSSQVTIGRWTRTGTLTAEMLQTYEELYEVMRSQEAPLIRAMVASSLGGGYDSIGDSAKAAHWKGLAAQEPPAAQSKHSGFLYGQDPFYHSLEEQRAPWPNGEEEERSRLLQELGRMEEYLDPDAISPEFLHHGIMKLLGMCNLYMGQLQFRGIEGCQIMTRTCLEYSDRFTALLTPNEKMEWHGKVLQTQARLSFIAACTRGPSPGVPDLALLARATEQYSEAHGILGRAGAVRDQAMVSQYLYNCYRMAWQQEGRQPLSPLFGRAVECLEEPLKALRLYSNVASQRLNRSFLFGLWAEGLMFRVEHGRMRPLWRWLGLSLAYRIGRSLGIWRWLPQLVQKLRPVLFTTPLEEAASALEQAEKLIDEERQNLSVLPGQQAILAKQHLRRDAQVASVFQNAPVVFLLGNQPKPLWQWVQRSKARSISDLLGIGNIIPSDLAERINHDPTASSMLAAEMEIIKGVNASTGADQFAARRRLDLHRRKMRSSNPHLAALLDLREGKPVEWEELAKLADTFKQPRRTWFVDWVVANGFIFLILVSDEKEFYHVERLDMDVAAVTRWIREHLDDAQGRPLDRPLDIEDTSLAALLELKPLVSHITTLAAEGDRLVLCPSAPLHRVPLHAAIVKGDAEDDPDDWAREWQTLMERNPTVYASSMTIYKQNMTRRLARGVANPLARGGSGGTALGVYEEPANLQDDPGWETERDEIYRACDGIASTMGWNGGARCGKAVGKPEMAAALQSGGAMVYFCGHFHYDEENVLDCGLLLGRADDGGGLVEDVQQPQPSPEKKRLLTTSELLKIKVTTPHVTLIACGSAKQKVDIGDEPLGVVTALLYAGATSVTGTMWPISSGDGRAFSDIFFNKVKDLHTKEDEVVDLAVLLQAAVKKLRRSEETSRPYCWAGFVLHGCWCL
ncbi:CHAT domain-containing protein [Chaetomium sp. MPI-CAGE-AT-0009]|nr:CHAT domain-containing protein [Chaetomium sp. MPI-CAGE-AT-0009]